MDSQNSLLPLEMEILQTHTHQLSKEASANWLSRLFFWWINPLIDVGSRQFLQESDLFDIIESEKINFNIQQFNKVESEKKSQELSSSFSKIFFTLCKREFILSFFFNFLSAILQLAGPLCLNRILIYLEDPTIQNYDGYIWASIMVFCYLLKAILQQHAFHYMNRIAQRIQGSLYGKIYEKLLRLSCSSKKYQDTGKIMNLINVDIYGVWNFCQLLLFGISAPIILVISIAIIVYQLSWIGFVGIIILLIGFFLQNFMQKYGYIYRKNMLNQTDVRSQAINEFINGIKIIKYYGWENMALTKIAKIREKECQTVMKQAILKGWTDMISTFFPLIISVVVFTIYGLEYSDFTAAKAYTVLSLFNLIQMPLSIAGHLMVTYVNAKTGILRIEHFNNCEEKIVEPNEFSLQIGEVLIEDGEFCWETENSYKLQQRAKLQNRPKSFRKIMIQSNFSINTPVSILKNINFQAKSGQFIAVIGQVGSGKSSFAFCILEEMIKISGKVQSNGKIAFVPQSAWLMNTTFRENILFYNDYNVKKYQEVLDLSELNSDIQLFPGGDMTEIGERGVNLSGGQKQRISLARALYDDADIYIIDDVLSALDAHIGKKIYNNVLRGALKNKTVIFITHALQYIQDADKILVFKQGEIIMQGDYSTLNSSSDNSEFKLISSGNSGKQYENNEPPPFLPVVLKNKSSKVLKRHTTVERIKDGFLMKVEDRSFGSVPWEIYRIYLSSSGLFFSFIMVMFFILNQVARFLNDWWLGMWASNVYDMNTEVYIGIYLSLIVVGSLMVYIRCQIFFSFTLKTSQKLQSNLMETIFKAPISWFDVTPIGRILSRTSKDQDNLDMNLPMTMQFCIINILKILGTIILAGIITPLFLILVVISVIIYGFLIGKYLKCSREIKRIELNSRGPVNSFFSETSNGLYVIRAFKKENVFFRKFLQKTENYTIAIQNNMYTTRWVGLRTDFFGAILLAASAYFGVLSREFNYVSNPSLIGLSISWVLNITQLLNFAIRLIADTENYMSSVQKINEYIQQTPQEKDYNFPKPQSPIWPTHGIIKAENLCYKYRGKLDYVIKNVSFETRSFEKIGVVGRTGSGKSTLTLGLLRILELVKDEFGNTGNIIIDGEDISQIGLHILRNNVTMIPQDPVLFSGTIRNNIDPFNECDDEIIKEALKKVNVWDYSKENGLEIKVQDGGNNFSLGQRQLFCLARALIRKPKLLIMDEATANIDEKTDLIIQKMIMNEFKETTVITIAHRLNTIIHYDRIMVFEHGSLLEFDTPHNLMEKKGLFSSLIEEYGNNIEREMKDLVIKKQILKTLDLDLSEISESKESDSLCNEVLNDMDFNMTARRRKAMLNDLVNTEGYDDRMSDVSFKELNHKINYF